MYEKDGEQYFVVDAHTHFWNASPENRNRLGEGFIACFYDYHRNLSPEEYVWPKEKYDRYSEEDMMHDLFEIGYDDMAILQPTYLRTSSPAGSTRSSRTPSSPRITRASSSSTARSTRATASADWTSCAARRRSTPSRA
jgi:hypothetical protein